MTVAAALLIAIAVSGCHATRQAPAVAATTPQDLFWSRIQPLCGRAFAGRLVEGSSPADSIFRRATLLMHVRTCTPTEIRIPFHADADRSRTWVLTRTREGLRLKHDHRHADGTEDAITQYGGDTRDTGSPSRQDFHADAHTAALIPAARTNVWTVEIVPGKQFVYALRRVGTGRRFRVEFDLTRPVAPPPPPWGAADYRNPAIAQEAGAASPASDSLRRLLADIHDKLAGIRAWRAVAEEVLSSDSATPRADTIFLELRTALEARLRYITRSFYKGSFQALVLPDGASAYHRRRSQGGANARPTPEEKLTADSLRAALAAGGIWSTRSEGTMYFTASEATLLSWLGRFLTPQLHAFLHFSAQQQAAPVGDDAALMITLDELAQRVLTAEQILNEFPQSPVRESIERTYHQYLAAYLGGVDNTPAFHWRSRALRSEFRQSHQNFLRSHASTAAGRVVAEYVRRLKRNGFVRTPEIDSFLQAQWSLVFARYAPDWSECALPYRGGWRRCL